MKVGIKYCGGCNNRFDRVAVVNQIKVKNTDVDFVIADDTEVLDYLLVINGCTAACADISEIRSRKGNFMLTNPNQLGEVQRILDGLKEEEILDQKKRHVLKIGDQAAFSKTITDADVMMFAGVTADFSRLHVDEVFAKESEFGKRIVHGMLVLSYLSTVMGMELPGHGTVFMGQKMKFIKPVFLGDTITARITFKRVIEQEKDYLGSFLGQCFNQYGELVLQGIFDQKMPKYYFALEEDM